jgi:hypothetical protein
MATKPLPFYEKDAERWADHVYVVKSYLDEAMRLMLPCKEKNLLDAAAMQCVSIADDIKQTLKERKRK